MNKVALPLEGIRVIEVGPMIMGPSCGLILHDPDDGVIKVEPTSNRDNTSADSARHRRDTT